MVFKEERGKEREHYLFMIIPSSPFLDLYFICPSTYLTFIYLPQFFLYLSTSQTVSLCLQPFSLVHI